MSEPASPSPRRPVVTAGFRNHRWDPALSEVRLTKGLLLNMKSFGYTKVRYGDGIVGSVDDLLRQRSLPNG